MQLGRPSEQRLVNVCCISFRLTFDWRYQLKTNLSISFTQSILNYDPISGIFTWRKRHGKGRSVSVFNALYAGMQAGSIVSSNKSKTNYIAIKINGKSYKAHRLAFLFMGENPPDEVDHLDHDGTNNKWENLRASNRFDNQKNLPIQKSNKTGVVGVNWHKAANKWQARAVDCSGKRIDIGRYDSFEDAVNARKKYEVEFKYYQNRDVV